MKFGKIIIISLIFLITFTSIGIISAADTSEGNIDTINTEININSQQDINSINEVNLDNLNNNVDNLNKDMNNLNNDIENVNVEITNKNTNNIENNYITNPKNKDYNLKSPSILNSRNTIIIDGSATNQMTTPTIQNAIDSANPGDTIIITGKNYVHCHFVVNKQLTIKSSVGTTMSTCPGSIAGSGSHGIFYISPSASGTIIEGFNLINDYGENDDYAVLIRGASDVKIINCTMNVSDGDGIRIENSINALLNNSIIRDSNIGVNIKNSTQTTIINNNITNNKITGIYIGDNNTNTTIHTNNITYNKYTGINMTSGNYVYVLNNFIAYNRNGDQSNSTAGAGVYVNCNITKIEIRGNYIKQNGYYGVLNDYRARNINAELGSEKIEVIDNNYFVGHTERVVYHIEYTEDSEGAFQYDEENDIYIYVGAGNGNYDMGKTVVYLEHAYLIDETVCGATLYKAPNIVRVENNLNLKISEITQVGKGIYQVSVVDADNNIITDLSSIYVTFYLNKNNTSTNPQKGDQYKTVLMQNGTATVDLSDFEYLETNNKITAVFPGNNYIYYTLNPYVIYNVNDSDIPGIYKQTKIVIKNMTYVPQSGEYYIAQLIDEKGNPLSNQEITFKISNKTYKRITDSNGSAKLQINLEKTGKYTITTTYNGNENYNKTSSSAIINIKKETPNIISSNVELIPKSGEYFIINLVNSNKEKIVNHEVNITIGSKTYKRITDSNGTVKLQINLIKTGKYTITIKTSKTNQYNNATKVNTVTIKTGANKVLLNTSDKTYLPKSGEYYVATLKDSKGNPLSNQEITFKISNKTYKRITDSNGTVKLQINLIKTGKYTITTTYNGNNIYSSASSKQTITIAKENIKLNTYNRTFIPKSGEYYVATLKDSKGNPLSNQEITFKISNKTYKRITDSNGTVKLQINLIKTGKYTITTTYAGTQQQNSATKTARINIVNKTSKSFVDPNLPNEEIQRILDENVNNYEVEFLGEKYNNIHLIINKSLKIYSNKHTNLSGQANNPVITIVTNNVSLSGIIINSLESDGIIINNSTNVNIDNNIIENTLNQSKIEEYNTGNTTLPGKGINIINSLNVELKNNIINSFESGIYTEYSNNLNIIQNEIKTNNYGIKYGFGVKNTKIINNTIKDNIGWYILDVPEGPRGYGVFLNNSAVNITINQNNISNNYIGISLDSNNSTGIVITSNLIADNSLEGIRFNAGYDLAENTIEPNVTDNAIYRNAEGPSMMILGEMSANPFGIYGAGEWNDSMKLKIDSNWYGVNSLRTWDNASGIVGVGTMCPRIKTTTINFTTIESTTPGTYKITFYKNGEIANNLATFDIYATLNRNTEKECEVHFEVVNGVGTFSFNKTNYLEDNKIEISVGSLINIESRIYTVIYNYPIPKSEIPT